MKEAFLKVQSNRLQRNVVTWHEVIVGKSFWAIKVCMNSQSLLMMHHSTRQVVSFIIIVSDELSVMFIGWQLL